MTNENFFIKQMNNGRWYVVRSARYTGKTLLCECVGWESERQAQSALEDELKVKNHDS